MPLKEPTDASGNVVETEQARLERETAEEIVKKQAKAAEEIAKTQAKATELKQEIQDTIMAKLPAYEFIK